MEEAKKSSNNKVLIIALIVILLGLVGYTFMNSGGSTDPVQSEEYVALQKEKEQMIANLTAMEEKYDVAISENSHLSSSLTKEKEKISALKDSVNNLEEIDPETLNRYKAQLNTLYAKNKKLSRQVGSLKKENKQLSGEKEQVEAQLEARTDSINNLSSENVVLAEKVKIAGAIKVDKVKVTAYKVSKNGEHSETTKAKKTGAIKIFYRLAENPLTTPGDKAAYIVVRNPKGQVINAKGVFTTTAGIDKKYTDETIVNYENSNLDVELIVVRKGDKKYEKGKYPIDIYMEGKLVGKTSIELK